MKKSFISTIIVVVVILFVTACTDNQELQENTKVEISKLEADYKFEEAIELAELAFEEYSNEEFLHTSEQIKARKQEIINNTIENVNNSVIKGSYTSAVNSCKILLDRMESEEVENKLKELNAEMDYIKLYVSLDEKLSKFCDYSDDVPGNTTGINLYINLLEDVILQCESIRNYPIDKEWNFYKTRYRMVDEIYLALNVYYTEFTEKSIEEQLIQFDGNELSALENFSFRSKLLIYNAELSYAYSMTGLKANYEKVVLDDLSRTQEETSPEAIDSQSVDNTFIEDVDLMPVLENITSNNNIYSEGIYGSVELQGFDMDDELFITDKNEIAFYIKDEVNEERVDYYETEHYSLYSYYDVVMIADKGKAMSESVAIINAYSDWMYHTNNGDILFEKNSYELVVITKDYKFAQIDFTKDVIYSENLNYYASVDFDQIQIINLVTFETVTFPIDNINNIKGENAYSFLTLSNDGHFTCCGSVMGSDRISVATSWNETTNDWFVVTKFGLTNLYQSSIDGKSLVVDDETLVMTRQYELVALTNDNEEVLKEYAEFENDTYIIETKSRMFNVGITNVSYNNFIVFYTDSGFADIKSNTTMFYNVYLNEWINDVRYEDFDENQFLKRGVLLRD